MVAFRRDLHQHPELSGEEQRTAEAVVAALAELGIEGRRVGATGVIADLPGPGPVVAIRADTDALPIHEDTGLSFASVNAGVMHACGHDGHSAMLLGAAALLLENPAPTAVRLIFQPAEETGDGAQSMIDAGALDGVCAIFGGHLDRSYPAGTLAISEGAVNASTDEFTLTLKGKGGHGARPHTAKDALLAGAVLVTTLQTVVSREIDPGQPAVITVGSFHAGNRPNVIAGSAVLEGTARAHDHGVREALLAAIERQARAVAAAQGVEVDVDIRRCTPPLRNPADGAALAWQIAEAVGATPVPFDVTNMGGEDFARYLLHVPGCYIRIGGDPGGESHPAHSSRFDFDEAALPHGAAWLAECARRGSQLAR
ncbi:MAG: amidohydrolase [Deltaproteobacteria bacterium]|nr:MAG: amidohydrolase [Deltaproteobacteria bacterium]